MSLYILICFPPPLCSLCSCSLRLFLLLLPLVSLLPFSPPRLRFSSPPLLSSSASLSLSLRQVTLVEMVVDLKSATGVKIASGAATTEADITWAEKRQNFRSTDQKVDRICGFCRGSLSSFAPFSKKVRTLSPSGLEFLQGLLCRPKFLCPRAGWIIARNALQAFQDCREKRRTGARPTSARGCLVPLLDVRLSYTTGCVVARPHVSLRKFVYEIV